MDNDKLIKFGAIRKKGEQKNEGSLHNNLVAQCQQDVRVKGNKADTTAEQQISPFQKNKKLPPLPEEISPLLPGLHLSVLEFIEGLSYSIQDPHWENGGRDLLFATYKAYAAKFFPSPSHDLPQILEALYDGSFTPSLNDLIEGGLTQNALNFMPEGWIVVKTPEGYEVEISSHKFSSEIEKLGGVSSEGRNELFGALKDLGDAFKEAFGDDVVGDSEVLTWAK